MTSPNIAAPGRQLNVLIAAEISASQGAVVVGMADAVRQRFGKSARAVLFYGSCLRVGNFEDKILDFYVIVDDYYTAYSSRWLAHANRILPPNAFYLEKDIGGNRMRAKYAVLSVDDFARRCRTETLNVSVWARFSQPAILVWAYDDAARQRMVGAVSDAVRTMIALVLPLLPYGATVADIWTRAFGLTYSAEFRPEDPDKGAELFRLNKARYEAITPVALGDLGVSFDQDNFDQGGNNPLRLSVSPGGTAHERSTRTWLYRRINGKSVNFLRLIKAGFTFDGGIDYVAYKIERHSGVKVPVKPWQRRHPIIAGLILFVTLRLKGAFR